MDHKDAAEVMHLFEQALYSEEELVGVQEGSVAPNDAVLVPGIVCNYGFHPERLEAARPKVRAMLEQMDYRFREEGGGGYSFIQMPFDRDGNQWCDQPTAEKLVVLAVGLNLMRYCIAERAFWAALPGSMPYLVIPKGAL